MHVCVYAHTHTHTHTHTIFFIIMRMAVIHAYIHANSLDAHKSSQFHRSAECLGCVHTHTHTCMHTYMQTHLMRTNPVNFTGAPSVLAASSSTLFTFFFSSPPSRYSCSWSTTSSCVCVRMGEYVFVCVCTSMRLPCFLSSCRRIQAGAHMYYNHTQNIHMLTIILIHLFLILPVVISSAISVLFPLSLHICTIYYLDTH